MYMDYVQCWIAYANTNDLALVHTMVLPLWPWDQFIKVYSLVFMCDWYILTIRYKVMCGDFTEHIQWHGEIQTENISFIPTVIIQ